MPKKVNNKKKNGSKRSKKSSSNVARSMPVVPFRNSVGVRPDKPSMATVKLSKCALKYAVACSDPFDPIARGVCVPIGSAPSHKVTAFTRFPMSIGLNGVGIILVAPSLANDMPSVYYTTSTYTTAGTFSSASIIGAGGTRSTLSAGWTNASHNGPYNVTEIAAGLGGIFTGPGVSGKIVSVGVRVQYTGTTLNQSGLVHCYHEPSHSSLAGVIPSDLGAFADTSIEPSSRDPCTLSILATSADEMNFSDNQYSQGSNLLAALYPFCNDTRAWSTTYNGATQYVAGDLPTSGGTYVYPVGCPVGAITVGGVAGQTYQVELIYHMEYEGVAAASSITNNFPDPIGASMVQSAALALPSKKLANPKSDLWSLMVRGLKEVAKETIPMVVPMVKTAIASLF